MMRRATGELTGTISEDPHTEHICCDLAIIRSYANLLPQWGQVGNRSSISVVPHLEHVIMGGLRG